MKTLLFILLTCFALTAHACFARLTDQYLSSNFTEKVCVYNHLGHTVTRVISASSPCRGSIMVEH